MDFRVKLALFKALEKMRHGNAAYYFLQRYITKSLVLDKDTFLDSYDSKVRAHLSVFAEYGATPLAESTYYEFGAGWDLLSVIGFSLNGMQTCICVDINRLVHVREIRETIAHYAECAELLGIQKPRACDETLTKENVESYLRDCFRIEYRAPYDARKTDLPSESVDYIASNVTLEHIATDDIRSIMAECCRILKHNGVVSVTIDHSDHWSHADGSITPYHYLRYSPAEWEKYNPSMHYQNRLRSSDYRKIFSDCGFNVLDVRLVAPDEADRTPLSDMQIADCFAKYSESDVYTTCSTYVLTKA